MKRIYLDANVLIAHYAVDKTEEAKKLLVENALDVFAQLKDLQLCTSFWSITEMVNILVSNKKWTVAHDGQADSTQIQLSPDKQEKAMQTVLE